MSSLSSDICMQLDAVTSLASHCDGDARSALNTLQVTVEAKSTKNHDSTEADPTLQKIITVDDIKEALQRSHVQYDRTGRQPWNCNIFSTNPYKINKFRSLKPNINYSFSNMTHGCKCQAVTL